MSAAPAAESAAILPQKQRPKTYSVARSKTLARAEEGRRPAKRGEHSSTVYTHSHTHFHTHTFLGESL